MTKYDLWHNQDLKLDIVNNMERFGGSFVKALAQCILLADWVNLPKLEQTFDEYITKYHPENWGKK